MDFLDLNFKEEDPIRKLQREMEELIFKSIKEVDPMKGLAERCDNVLTSPMIEEVGIVDRLKRRKAEQEKKLADINAAIEALEKNPEFVKSLDLLRRIGV